MKIEDNAKKIKKLQKDVQKLEIEQKKAKLRM